MDNAMGTMGFVMASGAMASANRASRDAKKLLLKSCIDSYEEEVCSDLCIKKAKLESTKVSIWREDAVYQTQNICTKEIIGQPYMVHQMPDSTEVLLGMGTALIIAAIVWAWVKFY